MQTKNIYVLRIDSGPLRRYYICLLLYKAGSCKENDTRASVGRMVSYFCMGFTLHRVLCNISYRVKAVWTNSCSSLPYKQMYILHMH